VNLDTNLSRRFNLKCREILDTSIGVAPAYRTRIKDNLAVRPTQRTFTNAYQVLCLPALTSKTRETAFQILNRTIWTNNKAFKSRMRPNPNCDRCDKTETMEHLLCECKNYSEPLWNKLADSWTRLFNDSSLEPVPWVELGQTNIIFNIPHPSLMLHVHDQASRQALLLLIQEIKRDICSIQKNEPAPLSAPVNWPNCLNPVPPQPMANSVNRLVSCQLGWPSILGWTSLWGAVEVQKYIKHYKYVWREKNRMPCLKMSTKLGTIFVSIRDAADATLPIVENFHNWLGCI
jgi:hypothetical protein